MRYFVQWWVIALALIALSFWTGYFGVFQDMWVTDATKITFVTLMVMLLASIHNAWATWRFDPDNLPQAEHDVEVTWFAADACMTLGLIGTAIGFVLMLKANFTGTSAVDPSTIVKLIGNIAGSLGTALYTTIVGIATALALKIQAFNLDYGISSHKLNTEERFFEGWGLE